LELGAAAKDDRKIEFVDDPCELGAAVDEPRRGGRFYLRKGQIEKGDVALAAETGGVDDASGGVV